MANRGVAVMGAVGGCGTTTMAIALAASVGLGVRRLLALDGHGGGPHVALGVPVARAVDDLEAVRLEVGPLHVEQIAHQGSGGWDLVAGPTGAAAYEVWSAESALRLGDALVAPGAWVADLGRGDHALAAPLAQRASIVVLMTSRSLLGADAALRALTHLAGLRTVIAALSRPGEAQMSLRGFRRLVGATDVVAVPWDRRGVERLPSCNGRRRGLAACVRDLARMVDARG